ncbi:MAG: hypothetical protein K2K35_12180, partial [Lachnospiraceae bacterium]|nr:hypothetical protein [Lachnospiraceae bacterium]
QDAIKDKIIINNLKNLHFYRMADDDTANKEIINNAKNILKSINSYDAKPEKVIIKENKYSTNIKHLKKVIEEIQTAGRWLLPSPVGSGKWYEVEPGGIKRSIMELFELYGQDYFTIILKDKKVLLDVFWDEEYNGTYSMHGLYCIFIKEL